MGTSLTFISNETLEFDLRQIEGQIKRRGWGGQRNIHRRIIIFLLIMQVYLDWN